MSQEFPFVGGTNDIPYSENLPMFTEYDWDFELDRFKTDGTGKRVHLTGDNALKVWVYKDRAQSVSGVLLSIWD